MPYLRRSRLLVLLLSLVSAAACGRAEDTDPPVATPALTLARGEAAVGSPLEMQYRFTVASNASFAEDYWVFVHFLDADGELMWTDDHQPPTPTRQWKPGDVIEYERTIFVPKFPYVGETVVEVGLFSQRTGQRLRLEGDTRGQRAYRVASFNMRLQTENLFVVFKDGWHPTEVAEDGAVEWQWSKKESTLAFRNPGRDLTLYLQLDQPVAALKDPQHVELRNGDIVLDSFPLPAGRLELRRTSISAAQLGSAETVELTLVVQRTFVPATMPEMKSSDPRELGVRVFRAYVQAK